MTTIVQRTIYKGCRAVWTFGEINIIIRTRDQELQLLLFHIYTNTGGGGTDANISDKRRVELSVQDLLFV